MRPMTRPTRLLDRLSRLIQNEGHAFGLKPTQWEVLRYLGMANRFSRQPAAITAYLGVTKGTVSQSLMALEKKGFVEKTPIAGDKRKVDIDLTEAGRDLLDKDPLAALDRLIVNLGAEERHVLEAQLEWVLRGWLTERGGRAFGVCKTCRYFETDNDAARCGLLGVDLRPDECAMICVEQTI
jgi:DNA-binding MarR family transcriptional regulator